MKTTWTVCYTYVWKSLAVFMLAIGSIIKTDAHAQSTLVKDRTSQAVQLDVMESIKKEVDDLDAKKQYRYAYKVIRDKLIEKPLSIDCMKYAISHAEKHLCDLKTFNTITTKSVYYPPLAPVQFKNGVFRTPAVTSPGYSYSNLKSFRSSGFINGYADIRKVGDDDILLPMSKFNETFKITPKEDALKVVNQYDLLKENVKFYLETLESSYSINVAKETKEAILILKDKAESLKDSILKSRCIYVSYVIVSPNLAEASKQISRATSIWPWSDDKDKLKDVAVNLAKAFNHEWIETSEQDVRIQLFEVLKDLKDHVGAAEWAELEMLTSMLDSNDPSKQRGAMAWWNE